MDNETADFDALFSIKKKNQSDEETESTGKMVVAKARKLRAAPTIDKDVAEDELPDFSNDAQSDAQSDAGDLPVPKMHNGRIAPPVPSKPVTPDSNVNGDNNGNLVSPTGTNEFFKGTPEATQAYVAELSRREEIEAEIIRTKGRYIESVDNARPGVPFNGSHANDFSVSPMNFVEPTKREYRADGVDFSGDIFDTGYGAQAALLSLPSDPEDPNSKPFDINDPRSAEYVTCGNGNCNYREGCLRYRMKSIKPEANKFVFFPDACRADGIYQSIDQFPGFTGYGTFEPTNLTSTPNF